MHSVGRKRFRRRNAALAPSAHAPHCISGRFRYDSTVLANPALLFGSFLFGAIGMAAFVYGRKLALWKPMVIGVALMAYPYFISQTWLVYVLGCALSAGLFVFRD